MINDDKKAVAKLKGGKADSICTVSADFFKAGDKDMIHGLHAVLTAE